MLWIAPALSIAIRGISSGHEDIGDREGTKNKSFSLTYHWDGSKIGSSGHLGGANADCNRAGRRSVVKVILNSSEA